VHLGACSRVRETESSAIIAESYLNELTSTGLEGPEWLDSLDAVLVEFAHTVGVAVVLSEYIDGIGSGSGIFRVARFLLPGWVSNLPVIASAW